MAGPKKRKPFKIPKQKLSLKELPLSRRTAYYAPRFGKYLGKHRGVAISTYRFVLRNLRNFRGRPLIDPITKVIVEETFTGSYHGSESRTFKITHGKKEFFMKLMPDYLYQNSAESYQAAENFFRQIGNKIGRYKIALVRPHLILRPDNQKAFRIVLTDFFNKEDIIHLAAEGMGKKEYTQRFKPEVEALKRLRENRGFGDLDRHNLFYHKKSRTLLFFDPI